MAYILHSLVHYYYMQQSKIMENISSVLAGSIHVINVLRISQLLLYLFSDDITKLGQCLICCVSL
jgi:hypothetical protein